MSEGSDYQALLELQRKNFEAQFGSLESLGYEDKLKQNEEPSEDNKSSRDSDSESGSESESSDSASDEFRGFSEDEMKNSESEEALDSSEEEDEEEDEEEQPVVVKFSDKQGATTAVQPQKTKNKVLRKGKIPSLHSLELKRKLDQIEIESEVLKSGSSKEDMENMQKDIELQRLLSESHFLSSSSGNAFSGADLTLRTIDDDPFGKVRAKTVSQRLRNLSGSVNDKRKLEKMPMGMRKGMLQKEVKRVQKFEQEAKDSGTILAKTKKYELRDLNLGRANKVGLKTDLIGKHTIGKRQLQDKYAHRKKGLLIQSIGKSTRNGLVINEKEFASKIASGYKNKGKKNNKKGRR